MIKYLLFDLDNTLYPQSAGVFQLLGKKIMEFILKEFDVSWDEATEIRQSYLKKYGTTMLGLVTEHNIDAEEYLESVHDFSLEGIVIPNKKLDKFLSQNSLPKVIFTNSPAHHAINVLDRLEIRHHFEEIYDICFFDNYVAKPHPSAYEKLIKELSVDYEECVFFDDSISNLTTAKELGMIPVYVCENGVDGGFKYQISEIEQFDSVIKQIMG